MKRICILFFVLSFVKAPLFAQINDSISQIILNNYFRITGKTNLKTLFTVIKCQDNVNKSKFTQTTSWQYPYLLCADFNREDGINSSFVYNSLGTYYIAHYPTCEQKEDDLDAKTIIKMSSNNNHSNFDYPHYVLELKDKIANNYLVSYKGDTTISLMKKNIALRIVRFEYQYVYKDFYFDTNSHTLKFIIDSVDTRKKMIYLDDYQYVQSFYTPFIRLLLDQDTHEVLAEYKSELIVIDDNINYEKFNLEYYK